VSDIRDWN